MIEWKKMLLVLVAGTSTSACDLLKDRPVGLGYSAKYICSYVFNSGIDEQVVSPLLDAKCHRIRAREAILSPIRLLRQRIVSLGSDRKQQCQT